MVPMSRCFYRRFRIIVSCFRLLLLVGGSRRREEAYDRRNGIVRNDAADCWKRNLDAIHRTSYTISHVLCAYDITGIPYPLRHVIHDHAPHIIRHTPLAIRQTPCVKLHAPRTMCRTAHGIPYTPYQFRNNPVHHTLQVIDYTACAICHTPFFYICLFYVTLIFFFILSLSPSSSLILQPLTSYIPLLMW